MVIYTCCDGSPGLFDEFCGDKGLFIMAEIVCTASLVGFKEDWFKLLVSRTCVEEMHFPLLFSRFCQVGASGNCEDSNSKVDNFSSEQAFLLRIIVEIVNERIEVILIPQDFALCVLGIFKRSVGVDFSSRYKSSLPTASTAINILGYSLPIFRDICARDVPAGSNSGGHSDVVDALQSYGLIELLLSFLFDLEPPAIILKAMRLNENQEGTSVYSSKTCLYIGFRKDIVAVISNCAYRRKRIIQDEIRERNGILLLLQQCVTDEDNPFLREWGIWCARNLLEGNAENQQVIADLELQGSVDVPELAGLGLKVEVDQKTWRAKLVNVPSKA